MKLKKCQENSLFHQSTVDYVSLKKIIFVKKISKMECLGVSLDNTFKDFASKDTSPTANETARCNIPLDNTFKGFASKDTSPTAIETVRCYIMRF